MVSQDEGSAENHANGAADTSQASSTGLPARKAAGGLADLVRYFLHLGTFGFGGPIATVGYMQRDLVDRRQWLPEDDFLDGIALGQTVPGPLAAQVVMWVGFLRGRAVGALVTAIAFILPSFLFVLVFAAVYVRFEGLSFLRALFYGVAPTVIAIIALAALKLSRTTNKREVRMWLISAIVFVVTVVTQAEVAALFVAAGLLMVLIEARPALPAWSHRGFALASVGGGITLGFGALGTNWALFLYFLKTGALIFGSGLAIVPFLHAGVVEQHHWLTEDQFLDAVAVGLITPGPVVITATFIGYLAGGLVGAVVATIAIFIPIYFGVVIPGPWFVRHRNNPQIRAFVRGATAAAAGAIGGVTVILARQSAAEPATALIAACALVLLWRFKVSEPVLVAIAGVAGLILY